MSGHEASGGQRTKTPEDTPTQHQRRPSRWPVRWRHDRAVMTDRDLQAPFNDHRSVRTLVMRDQVPAIQICATLRVTASQ
jgi:hypothetical protein